MMKKYIYILFAVLLSGLFGCQKETLEATAEFNGKEKTLEFRINLPDFAEPYTRVARENQIKDMWLLTFDQNGYFIKRVQATELTNTDTGGTFKAVVPDNTKIIHFIDNYGKWSSLDDRAMVGKDEREVLPGLVDSRLMFWGRNEVSSLSDPVSVVLYRNQAKIVVQSQTVSFQLTGYAVMNYVARGTASPFNPAASPTPFVLSDTPTLPGGTLNNNNQEAKDCTLDPKFIFEDENDYNNQIYVIIKGRLNGGDEQFYKIQLLDKDKKPYPIVRNSLYNVRIRSFNADAHGSDTFEEAMAAEPSNNLYAEIFKDSPVISDNRNNVLTISRLNFLFVQSGALELTAGYTKNGTPANDEIEVNIISDPGNIIHGLSYDGSGNITANISHVIAGQQEAVISVQAGILSRLITVLSSELYEFDPVSVSPEFYTQVDQEITLSFEIPAEVPYYLFPMECLIKSEKLYPAGTNSSLPVRYVDGTYKYVYTANGPGTASVRFKTAVEESDETVSIENQYFKTAFAGIKSKHFSDVSINGNNVIDYGTGSTATLRFTIAADDSDFPLTVRVETANLTTTQNGWNAVSGGFEYTFATPVTGEQTVAFASDKEISYEKVVVSATGFSSAVIRTENIIATPVNISNKIRQKEFSGTIHDVDQSYAVNSSSPSIVQSLTIDSQSIYTTTVLSGAKLSDWITFTYFFYVDSYSVEQLLQSPEILLKTNLN